MHYLFSIEKRPPVGHPCTHAINIQMIIIVSLIRLSFDRKSETKQEQPHRQSIKKFFYTYRPIEGTQYCHSRDAKCATMSTCHRPGWHWHLSIVCILFIHCEARTGVVSAFEMARRIFRLQAAKKMTSNSQTATLENRQKMWELKWNQMKWEQKKNPNNNDDDDNVDDDDINNDIEFKVNRLCIVQFVHCYANWKWARESSLTIIQLFLFDSAIRFLCVSICVVVVDVWKVWCLYGARHAHAGEHPTLCAFAHCSDWTGRPQQQQPVWRHATRTKPLLFIIHRA